MPEKRRGLVVYQLLLILLGLALLIWLIFALINRRGTAPVSAPADSAVVDTAPFPVPEMSADTAASIADTAAQ